MEVLCRFPAVGGSPPPSLMSLQGDGGGALIYVCTERFLCPFLDAKNITGKRKHPKKESGSPVREWGGGGGGEPFPFLSSSCP